MILETKEDVKSFKEGKIIAQLKTAPTIVPNQETIDVNPKETDDRAVALANIQKYGYIRRFIPYFIYKPPFGFPRRDIDLLNCRRLAKTPFVFSVIKTLLDEICGAKWDIVPNEDVDEEKVNGKVKIIKEFFYNPNGNNQSFRALLRAICRDVLELDAGVLEKVYNRKGELTQLFSVDGSTILINTDEHGYIGNRQDYIPVIDFTNMESHEIISHYYTNYLKEQAAYFQYNWTGGVWPVPFGKKQMVYIMANDNSDSIYGTSPVQVLYNILLMLMYATQLNLDMYANNNIPTGILSILNANKSQIDATREYFNRVTQQTDVYGNQTKKYFNVPISPFEIEYKDFRISAKDMQMIEQQKWYQQVVWQVFGVTPDEMGSTSDSNRSVANEQSRIFKRKALVPILNLIEYHFNTQIVWELDPQKEVMFKFNDYDIEQEFRKAELNEKLLNTTWTLNEIREKDNMKPFEDEAYDKPKAQGHSDMSQNPMFSGMNQLDNKGNQQDMQNEERSPEKDGKGKEKDDFKIFKTLKHKYTKREGSSGNYTYYYDEPKGDKPLAIEIDTETSDKINSFFKYDNVDTFFTNNDNPNKRIKDLTEAIGLDSADYNDRKKAILSLFETKTKDIGNLIKSMKTTFDYRTSFEERERSHRISYTLGNLGTHLSLFSKTTDEERENLITNLREGLDNDVAQINTALKYMGLKERVKKDGLREKAQAKTIDEVNESLTEIDYKGIKYKLSPNYIKNDEVFKSETELNEKFKEIIDSFPDAARSAIVKGDTKVHFVTRTDAKKLIRVASNRAAGYYVRDNKQIYIFPTKKGHFSSFNVDKEEMLSAGYDEEMIDKLKVISGKKNWQHTVTHELSHATALNPNGPYVKIQDEYTDWRMSKYIDEKKKATTDDLITNYAATNAREDFAETMAFYVNNKELVDKGIATGEKWLSPMLQEKFKWLRENLWK